MKNLLKTFLFIIILLCFPAFKSSAQVQFSGERLEIAARNYVQKVFKDSDVEIEFNGDIADRSFKETGITARITGDAASILAFKRIGLEFVKDGAVIKKVDIPVRIKVFKTVACAARELPGGTVVKANDVLLLKKEMAEINENEIIDKQEIIGKTIAKPVFKTGIITRSSLLSGGVRRNTMVDVIVQSGTVSIRTSGKVLNDASIGESVRISRDNGAGIVTGKVAKNGSVIILPQ